MFYPVIPVFYAPFPEFYPPAVYQDALFPIAPAESAGEEEPGHVPAQYAICEEAKEGTGGSPEGAAETTKESTGGSPNASTVEMPTVEMPKVETLELRRGPVRFDEYETEEAKAGWRVSGRSVSFHESVVFDREPSTTKFRKHRESRRKVIVDEYVFENKPEEFFEVKPKSLEWPKFLFKALGEAGIPVPAVSTDESDAGRPVPLGVWAMKVSSQCRAAFNADGKKLLPVSDVGGNCFFRCLALLLDGDEQFWPQYRAGVAAFMQAKLEELGDTGTCTPGTFASGEDIKGAATLLGVSVMIYNAQGEKRITGNSKRVICLTHGGGDEDGHFNALV